MVCCVITLKMQLIASPRNTATGCGITLKSNGIIPKRNGTILNTRGIIYKCSGMTSTCITHKMSRMSPPNTKANTEACCSVWRHHLKSQLSVHYDLDTPFPKKFSCTIITFDWPLLCFHITNKMQSVYSSAICSCFTTSWTIPLDGLWFKASLYSLKCYGVCLGRYKGKFMPNIFWCFFLFVLSFFLLVDYL